MGLIFRRSGRNRRRRNLQRLVPESFEEDTTEVALAERGQNHDDQFPLIFRAARHLQGRDYRRSRGDADEQTFFQREPARHVDGVVIADGDDLVDVVPTQDAGNKTGPNSLNFVRAWLSAGKNRTVDRLHSDSFERRLLGLDVFGDTGDGAASAYSGDEKIDAAVGVFPDLGTGGFEMNLGIGRIVELLKDVAVGSRGEQFFGFQNRALHS